MKVLHFHMLCTADVLQVVSEGDWFISIDLKDAYFPLHPTTDSSFAFEGSSIPLLCSALQALTHPSDLSPLQSNGIRILPPGRLATTRKHAIRDTGLLTHVTQLVLTVNFAKSCLIPS